MSTQAKTASPDVQSEIQQQAAKVLSQVAGYVGVRTMDIGLRFGLFEELTKHPAGLSADDLAASTGLDPLYAQVWCRSAYASELLELDDGSNFKLAPHMDKLLLDTDFPGYVGGVPQVVVQPEMFDRFAENFRSGERIWWDQCSPLWIEKVSGTGRAFYNRLIPAGLSRVPGLEARLSEGARILELASGAGVGLIKLGKAYPNCSIAGLDGDQYSLDMAADKIREAGLEDRVSLVHSSFEAMDAEDEYDVAINNISMHECRDIEQATANVLRSLKPGGYFVISDFPFPESVEACRTVPARVMCGIQFFEALIDDQLLPPSFYEELLNRHGFKDVGTIELTPVHALVYGQK